jgi:hypothetical protein
MRGVIVTTSMLALDSSYMDDALRNEEILCLDYAEAVAGNHDDSRNHHDILAHPLAIAMQEKSSLACEVSFICMRMKLWILTNFLRPRVSSPTRVAQRARARYLLRRAIAALSKTD